MADPKPEKYFYDGDLPAHSSFFDPATGAEETFELKASFSLSNPLHTQIADNLVAAGILSKTAPKKEG